MKKVNKLLEQTAKDSLLEISLDDLTTKKNLLQEIRKNDSMISFEGWESSNRKKIQSTSTTLVKKKIYRRNKSFNKELFFSLSKYKKSNSKFLKTKIRDQLKPFILQKGIEPEKRKNLISCKCDQFSDTCHKKNQNLNRLPEKILEAIKKKAQKIEKEFISTKPNIFSTKRFNSRRRISSMDFISSSRINEKGKFARIINSKENFDSKLKEKYLKQKNLKETKMLKKYCSNIPKENVSKAAIKPRGVVKGSNFRKYSRKNQKISIPFSKNILNKIRDKKRITSHHDIRKLKQQKRSSLYFGCTNLVLKKVGSNSATKKNFGSYSSRLNRRFEKKPFITIKRLKNVSNSNSRNKMENFICTERSLSKM